MPRRNRRRPQPELNHFTALAASLAAAWEAEHPRRRRREAPAFPERPTYEQARARLGL